jgi:CO/xanthine dehydrogenase Mo-binding subunit
MLCSIRCPTRRCSRICRKPGKLERAEGDADAALKSAAKVISAEYYSPHLAHATMEPPSATARMADGKLEIWTSVQSPGGARDDVAKRLGFDPKNVTLQTRYWAAASAASRNGTSPSKRRF